MSNYVNYINNYTNVTDINNMNNMNNMNNNYDINTNINDNNNEEQIYQTFYYLGQHTEGSDQYGPIIVYHYISDEMRNGRNLNTLDIWDYDLEIWPGDRYWRDAGRGRNLTIEVGEIPY